MMAVWGILFFNHLIRYRVSHRVAIGFSSLIRVYFCIRNRTIKVDGFGCFFYVLEINGLGNDFERSLT